MWQNEKRSLGWKTRGEIEERPLEVGSRLNLGKRESTRLTKCCAGSLRSGNVSAWRRANRSIQYSEGPLVHVHLRGQVQINLVPRAELTIRSKKGSDTTCKWHKECHTILTTSNNNGDITSTTNWRETAWDQYLSELLWYASECKHSGFWAHFTNRGSRTERNRAAWLFWNAGRTTGRTWRDWSTEWSVAASPRLWTAGWSQNGAVYGPCRTQRPQFNFDLALNRSISNLNDLELPGNAFTPPHTTTKGRQNSLSLLSPLWKSFKYI